MVESSFRSFVEARLDTGPSPVGLDPTDPLYWVGAGEVMVDILMASTSPAGSDTVLSKIESDIAAGDPIAAMAKSLLNIWAGKKSAGETRSLAFQIDAASAQDTVAAYRALILIYTSAADLDRIRVVDDVLTLRADRGHILSTVLKAMLETAMADLQSLARKAVQRAVSESDSSASGTRAEGQSHSSAGKSGCFVATAVYGSYDCPEVWVLRRFRDRTLSSSRLGRIFIHVYYLLGPGTARIGSRNKWFMFTVRALLDEFVRQLHAKGYAASPYVDPETMARPS